RVLHAEARRLDPLHLRPRRALPRHGALPGVRPSPHPRLAAGRSPGRGGAHARPRAPRERLHGRALPQASRPLPRLRGGAADERSRRIGLGLDQLGARTPDEDLAKVRASLAKRPYDYFRMFYGDTALFGAGHAVACAIEFFGVDHILFRTDMPFDPEKGPQFIRET